MLIEFSVGNFLSIKDVKTLSMVAGNIKELEADNLILLDNSKFNLLKSAVIYGANASGKSNLIKAFDFFKSYIKNSAKNLQYSEFIPVENFKLSEICDNKPSFFEMVFIQKNIRYRYGFEINNIRVISEWLYYVPGKLEVLLFERTGQEQFEIGKNLKKESKDIKEKTKENTLFLSALAQWNSEIAKNIMDWFKRLNILSGLDDESYLGYTQKKCEEVPFRETIIEFIKKSDLGIDDIVIEKKDVPIQEFTKSMPDSLNRFFAEKEKSGTVNVSNINTYHKKYNENGEVISTVKFDLEEDESEGTKKFFALTGPLIDTLQNGKILVIDELDSRLHPLLTQMIVKLFNSQITNRNNAQLIFASHDTNILDRRFFRRDQIWFTEKDQFSATDLYSLMDYKIERKKIRNDASYEKDYILGKYGAIPFLGDFYSIFKNGH